MIKKSVIIIGSVALLGVGVYIYFKSQAKDKSSTDPNSTNNDLKGNLDTSTLDNKVTISKDPVTNEFLKQPVVITLTNDDMLKIQQLRDTILEQIRIRNGYKKQSSRDNVQVEIDSNMNKLKTYGYSLDLQNNLIKIQ